MPISPELLKIMKERMRGTMMELIGFLLLEVSKERVVAELPFRDDLTQPTGLLHAGAILTLADTAATILANQNTMPGPGKCAPSQFAMTVQLSANFVRNSSTKKIVAEAIPVHVGRRTLVVQTTVCDEDGNLFATVTTTMMTSIAT
jgi:1,4-dihydroxy-2-naphthoyl-CoA hydrolase